VRGGALRRHRCAAGAIAAAALTVLAAAGCGGAASTSHSSATAASSPGCLPATVDHSGRLAGVGVDVSPEPGTDTANPRTQISFLGVGASRLAVVSVLGARSGVHAGRLEAYSQGDGASFVPAKPFAPGERVTVNAEIAGKRVSFGFGVDTPYSTATIAEYANPAAAAADYQTFETLPGVQAPILSVTGPDRDPAAGDVLTTNGPGAGPYGPLIYTPQGRLIWVHQLSGGLTAEDLNVQTYAGHSDLTFWQGRVLSWGFGQGEDIVMNSAYQTVATIRAGNGLKADLHEFQIAPHDIAYITAYNPISCNLSSVGGARHDVITDAAVQAIDMKTGLVRWEWHSLDHVAVSESETSPPKGSSWDWFHLNSIDPEGDGDVLISARNTWAAYQIQAGSGRILWRLGGLDSSFSMGLGTRTAWQHDARMLPDGDVTMFDDGTSQSRAVRIALNLRTRQASLVSAISHPSPPLLAASQGNVQTLADGNILVGYGGVPEISEYSPSGSLLFDAHLSYDLIFYRAFRHPWDGIPRRQPTAIANLNNTGLETIVHMSWNGATGVSSWRVLAGAGAGTLRAQATVPSSGFESATILPARYGRVEVQALDSAGAVLGTSAAAKVRSYAALLPSAPRPR
jgi:arylsulfotransferase ASST